MYHRICKISSAGTNSCLTENARRCYYFAIWGCQALKQTIVVDLEVEDNIGQNDMSKCDVCNTICKHVIRKYTYVSSLKMR